MMNMNMTGGQGYTPPGGRGIPSPTFGGSNSGVPDWMTQMFGGLGTAAGGMFGGQGKNPADVANGYINQIPGQTKPYYSPYMDAGKGAMGNLQNQYADLLSGNVQNKLGENYKESPGYQFKLQEALRGGNAAAAAGGRAGTPMAQQQQMGIANGLASQDYGDYIKNQIGLYGQGLSGNEGLNQMGFDANKGYADMLGQNLSQQGAYGFMGQQGQNQANQQNKSNIFSGLGMAAGGLFGGPAGAAAGGWLSHLFGG